MSSRRPFPCLTAVLTLALSLLTIARPLFAANNEHVLYSFCSVSGCADGANPLYGSLVADSAGNLYGTTYGGGADGYGAVFQLAPQPNGKWTETVLYSFTNNNGDGAYPNASLIFDADGNLYGTTMGGGVSTLECGNLGCGTVFQLTLGKSDWAEKVLYQFCSVADCADGFDPQGGLIFDSAGDLDGTTFFGGQAIGTVFQLTPGKNGQWTENVLYNFCSVAGCTDGFNPSGSLIFDSAGNIYGTTTGGGTSGYGTAFQLAPGAKGQWTETVLHNFLIDTHDGIIPLAGMIFDAAGNLYGTAEGGGLFNGGIIFELTLSHGAWNEKILHSFNGKDGSSVYGGLIFDASGNLYGTTLDGGASGTGCGGSGCGTVFQLQPKGKGNWTEKLLHSFRANGKDGNNPYSGLIFASGNLYGVTYAGGANNSGTVFEIAP